MRKRKRLYSPTFGDVPRGEVVIKEPNFKKDYRPDFLKEEQELRDRPIKKLEREISQGLAENQGNVVETFSLPIEALQNVRPSQVPLDMAVNYPTTTEPPTVDEYRQVQHEFFKAYSAKGITISESGWIRLNIYTGMLAWKRGFAVTVEMLEASLQRLVDLGCFASGEVTGVQLTKRATVTPQPEPLSVDQYFDSLKSDDDRSKNIVGRNFQKDIRDIFTGWCSSMMEKWSVDVWTQVWADRCGDYFVKFNKNPLSKRSYDEFRLYAWRQGWFEDGRDYRTPDEAAADFVELNDMSNRDNRAEFSRRHREILGNSTIPVHK